MITVPFKTKREMLSYLSVIGNKVVHLINSEIIYIKPDGELNRDYDLHPAEEFAPYTEPKKKVLYHYVYRHPEAGSWYFSATLFENDAQFLEAFGGVKQFKRLDPAIEISL